MVLPCLAVNAVRHIVRTDIDEYLRRREIQEHGVDLPEEIVRRRSADAAVIDACLNARRNRHLCDRELLHQGRPRKKDSAGFRHGVQGTVIFDLLRLLFFHAFHHLYADTLRKLCHNLPVQFALSDFLCYHLFKPPL